MEGEEGEPRRVSTRIGVVTRMGDVTRMGNVTRRGDVTSPLSKVSKVYMCMDACMHG